MTRTVSTIAKARTVYVIGAGFSAGLSYPLVNDLLIRLWDRLPMAQRVKLGKVIKFQHPGFDPSSRTSFPTIEHFLSEIMASEQLFEACHPVPGKFTLRSLKNIHRDLLLAIVDWFHEMHKETFGNLPHWLKVFRDDVLEPGDTLISFNWDLILDHLLYGETIDAASYGFSLRGARRQVLLKPHGSLNWYDGAQETQIGQDRRVELHKDMGGHNVYAFRHFQSPRPEARRYMPLIVPPVYNKDFGPQLFQNIWRACVADLSTARKVVFLGYSLSDADLHARHVLRQGFHNQIVGQWLCNGTRAKPAGKATVVIVNPDQGAAARIERTVGSKIRCEWYPIPVSGWVDTLNLAAPRRA